MRISNRRNIQHGRPAMGGSVPGLQQGNPMPLGRPDSNGGGPQPGFEIPHPGQTPIIPPGVQPGAVPGNIGTIQPPISPAFQNLGQPGTPPGGGIYGQPVKSGTATGTVGPTPQGNPIPAPGIPPQGGGYGRPTMMAGGAPATGGPRMLGGTTPFGRLGR